MTTYSTAYYRREAQAEEAVLNWFRAGMLWRKAISVYPTTGALADLDKSKMRKRAETCERMSAQEQ
jgi:hypothetical protein